MTVLCLAACDDGGGSGENSARDPVTYTGTANSVTYTLKIEDGGARAVLTPAQGDKYTLTAGSGASVKTSAGTVNSFAAGVLFLTPSNSSTAFTVTVTGTNITSMSGIIKWNNGDEENAPDFAGNGQNPDYVFVINGYVPPAGFNDIQSMIYASTNANFKLQTELLAAVTTATADSGQIDDDGKVDWNIRIPNGTYTLYLVQGVVQATLLKTPAPVSIANGNGEVDISVFVEVPQNGGGGEGGDPASFAGTWKYAPGGVMSYVFTFTESAWSYGNSANNGPVGVINEGTYTVEGNTATLNYIVGLTPFTATATIGGSGNTLTTTLDVASLFTFTKQL